MKNASPIATLLSFLLLFSCGNDTNSKETEESAQVGTPVISPAGGDYSNAVSITITTVTESAAIHYTLDGRTPTEGDALYSGPFSLSDSAVVTARAFRSGFQASEASSQTYIIDGQGLHQVEAPVISPAGRTSDLPVTVTILAVDGATVHYTTNDTEPTESSPTYSTPFLLDQKGTFKVRAKAFKDGMDPSLEAEPQTYVITTEAVYATIEVYFEGIDGTETLQVQDGMMTLAHVSGGTPYSPASVKVTAPGGTPPPSYAAWPIASPFSLSPPLPAITGDYDFIPASSIVRHPGRGTISVTGPNQITITDNGTGYYPYWFTFTYSYRQ